MSNAANSYKSATLPGLARAFRPWTAMVGELTPVDVPGASLDERNALVDPAGRADSSVARVAYRQHRYVTLGHSARMKG